MVLVSSSALIRYRKMRKDVAQMRLDLDMIYEINTKLISKALLSVFCQVFCYFYCRNAKKCPLLSFMRILSMEPSDR